MKTQREHRRDGPSGVDSSAAFVRFQERQQRNRQVREAALETLASILDPKVYRAPAANGSPALVAARAVGEALGVTIRPPATSEDSGQGSEALAAIARASQLRLRRVRLSGPWWQYASGPLLAYTQEGHRPV